MPKHLVRRTVLIGLATLFVWAVHAQPAPTEQPPPNAVSVEQSATFDVTPVSGTLKETVQKEQRLTDMSVAFLRNQATGEVKVTFAGDVSAFGWRPDGEPKLNVIVRTRGGASIYSWTFVVSVRCADNNRPSSVSQTVPDDLAANIFNSVGSVEISEYREPNSPILTVRPCPS
jgi:hypothetical protein